MRCERSGKPRHADVALRMEHPLHSDRAARGELFDDAGDERAVPRDRIEVAVRRSAAHRTRRQILRAGDAPEVGRGEPEQVWSFVVGVVPATREPAVEHTDHDVVGRCPAVVWAQWFGTDRCGHHGAHRRLAGGQQVQRFGIGLPGIGRPRIGLPRVRLPRVRLPRIGRPRIGSHLGGERRMRRAAATIGVVREVHDVELRSVSAGHQFVDLGRRVGDPVDHVPLADRRPCVVAVDLITDVVVDLIEDRRRRVVVVGEVAGVGQRPERRVVEEESTGAVGDGWVTGEHGDPVAVVAAGSVGFGWVVVGHGQPPVVDGDAARRRRIASV